MNEKRPAAGQITGQRTTGIPKPSSRLPLPRSSIPMPSASAAPRSIQPAETPRVSTQSLAASTIRNPRLRTSSSREQLNTSSSLRQSQRSNAPPVSSQSALRNSRTRSRSTSRGLQTSSLQTHQEADHVPPTRPLVPRRRPSVQFVQPAQEVSIEEDIPPTQEGEDDQATALPPLPNSPEEGLTFEALLSRPKKSRLSLAERTIETLSQLPSSPAPKRRGSNMFDSDGFRRPQSKGSTESRPGSSYQSDGPGSRARSLSRPGSSLNRPGSSLSRPGSSSGPYDSLYNDFRASTNTYKPPLTTVYGTPSRGISGVGSLTTPVGKSTPKFTPRSTLSKMPSWTSLSASVGPGTPSPEKYAQAFLPRYGSKTIAPRSLKPRASMNRLFKKPSMPSLDKPTAATKVPGSHPRKVSLASAKSFSTSGEGRNLSSASTVSTTPTVDSVDDAPSSSSLKSSAALREQIAKAKASKRAVSRQVSGATATEAEASVVPTDNTFDFGLSDDPFGQHSFESSNRKVMQSRINTARTTGRLNIAAMGLKEIPEDVLNMYDMESIGRANGSWAESVDLSRFVAADNELETIDDAIFPDIDPNDFEEEDDRGRIFLGLESADLHNNMLIALPMGLRRLQQLTLLNLASNKLTNNCLEVISQCTALRDLKLGNNLLYGALEDCFVLENLEILDVHGNNLSALPSGIGNMKRLRILNLDENAFESLPFDQLSKLPLTELLVRKNKLSGTLIESGVQSLPQLQLLDCSSNQLTYLVSPDVAQPLSLPSLHQLTVSMNRLKSLPDMSSWTSILTINAEDNSIAALPDGFTTCETLRHAGFSSNDIRTIPPDIAHMDGLAMLRLTGNPLRDKKFTSLTTEELKDALAARLQPLPAHDINGAAEHSGNGPNRARAASSSVTNSLGRITNSVGLEEDGDGDDDDGRSDYDDFATPPTSAPQSPARSRSQTLSSQTWPMKPGGVLDRSNTQSSSLHPVVCSKIAAAHTVREVRLQHNTFTQFPNSLSFFADTITSLCMSHNQLTGESWLTEQMDLTALRELHLQSNFCTSLTPLTTYLCAPNLERLDVSFNRIVRVPALRDFFPSLTVLLISNNRLEELDPDSVQGMKIVDASNNELAHLNPRLGLQSLERLDVMGNRFRVPRWNVLERGTEATLRWLRGRVPVAEMAEWRAKAGRGESESAGEVD
ncbi:Uu.00g121570.m01.CDS01 [Anthostomella pinea]|uniref:Uu.00g121570.m01.CDS01 n=1 Tax=Anthostomella pinea TaxID=933095 RepID=A0AAI8VGY6_9PEZI|nr:Uu.00g121570.m01.CDS01 [Anthostomella pinea]